MTKPATCHYDVVGSFFDPHALRTLAPSTLSALSTMLRSKPVENECIAELIEKEKAAGLPFLTDGEFRRSYWHLDFMWGLHGVGAQFELDQATSSWARKRPRVRPS